MEQDKERFDVIIAGSRDFADYALLRQKCDICFTHRKPTAIISGTARGVDRMGEQYAKERGVPVKQFPANWEKYGKSAGYRRNEEMAQCADALIAVWDGQSKGTKHMIDTAKKMGIPMRIIMF